MALPTITASRAYVRNLDTGEAYYSKGTGAVKCASLTKLMSCYILLQNKEEADLSATATVTSGDQAGGTGNNLNNGDVVSLRELLYDSLIPSSNTATNVYARVIGDELGGAGGTTRFIAEMATQASLLGMSDSVFDTTHGFSNAESTPEDMYLLVKAMYDASWFPLVREIIGNGRYRVSLTRSGSPTSVVVDSTNQCLGEIGVIGGKTGSLSAESVYNVAVLWEAPNGQTIYICVMGATGGDDRFDDVRAIIAQLPLDFPDLASAAVPFTPAYLFDTLGMGGGWWDGSDNSTMWQDTGKETPVSANDDPVAWWEPKASGTSGLAWRQTTSANRPLFKSADGRVAFDGSNDFLTLGSQDIGDTGLFCDAAERFMVCIRFGMTGDGAIFAKASATNSNRTLQIYRDGSAGNRNGVYFRGVSSRPTNIDLADAATRVIGLYWNGAGAYHAVDALGGPKQCEVGTASEESQNILLGARTESSPAFFLTGSVYQVVITDEVLGLDLFRRLRDWANGGTVNAFADPAGGVVEPAEGSGTISAVGSIEGAGYAARGGAGSVDAVGALAGEGEAPDVAEAEGGGSVAGTGALTGTGYAAHSGSGGVSGVASLVGTGDAPSLGTPEGSGTISAVGSLVGEGYVVRYGYGGITAAGLLVGEGDAPAEAAAGEGGGELVGVGTLAGAGYTQRYGSGSVDGTGSLVGGSTQSAAVVVSHFLYVRPRRR